ncbi:hypothetical protein DL769_000624 [Monosporascus sp. CRB-8-3]|nr:hypothetical protein DL769_000624 [Monosporascus sp. CRB-8-3]
MSRSPEDSSSPSVRTEMAVYPEYTDGLWDAMGEKLNKIAAVRARVFEAYKGIFLNGDYERNIARTKAAIDLLRPQIGAAVGPCCEDLPGSIAAWAHRLTIDYYALVEHLDDPHMPLREREALGTAVAELELIFGEPGLIIPDAAVWSECRTISEATIETYLRRAENPPFRELGAGALAMFTQTELDFHDCMETMGYWLLALEEAEVDTIEGLVLQDTYEEAKKIITDASYLL